MFISDALSFRPMQVKQHQTQGRLQVGYPMLQKKGCKTGVEFEEQELMIEGDAGKTKAMSSLYFRSRKRTIDCQDESGLYLQ